MTSLLDRDTGHSKWPDVEAVPRSPLRAAVARALLRRVCGKLKLRVEFPDGRVMGASASHRPALRLHDPDAFLHRLGTSGLIGFGESYQAGDWDSDDLTGVLTVLAGNVDTLVPPSLQWLRRFYVSALPRSQDNSLGSSLRNISHHYDLSNELFGTFLDPTMTYSSALFGSSAPSWSNLPDAQNRKIDRLLDQAGVTAGTRVLEIGTGWGELAVRAARRGATVETITLSTQQLRYARARAEAAGLADRIRVRLCDYRELSAQHRFDAILSVEMIEAVGERYWPTYFKVLDRLLTDNGRVGLQAISMRHDRMMAARRTYTWIHKYIFPGGLIPSVPVIKDQVRRHTRLRISADHAFGVDYAHTLRLWRERFLANALPIDHMGFDGIFRRTWEFYLAYSEAGFASGYLDVHQFTLRRT